MAEAHSTGISLSFVIPVHNEEKSLVELLRRIEDVCTKQHYTYEVIFVDDGSSDGSFAVLQELSSRNPLVKITRFRRNYGQTAALNAGIHASTAPLIITLDGDLQNDPADVPHLLRELEKGFDVVSGWRKKRRENILRRIPSRCANALISKVTGVQLSDYGCTLKVYKRAFLENVPLYGEMHRFIPVFAAWGGAKVSEIPVTHFARQFGRSHYGLRRTGRVLLDLLTVKFLHTYIAKPMHFFGGIGIWFMGGGMVTGVTALLLKFWHIRSFVDTPLPLLAAFLTIVGAQFILMGLLAELLIRIYFEQPGRSSYRIASAVGVPADRL